MPRSARPPWWANAFGVETRLHFSTAAAPRSRLLASRNVKSVSGRYFAAFFLLFASARRSVFLRRAARFLTLSLPWLFPIGLTLTLSAQVPSCFVVSPLKTPCRESGDRCTAPSILQSYMARSI